MKQLKLIIFLKELGFSLRNIQKIIEDPNSEKTISLLLEDQLEENVHEIRKLEKQNKQISLLTK
ncbi:MerR family DNA-binding protein [Lactobacillus intestinalis]|uniref:MerR family DNA-binding protein n=1 Tax=Lactobacillus intestinalis TaxID=151781 RepID=UPI00242DE274|nr:MerR family DNA-binding protein [Lactobacillus intestinalis]